MGVMSADTDVLVVDTHLFSTEDQPETGRCGVCEEPWEHPNHKAEHKSRRAAR